MSEDRESYGNGPGGFEEEVVQSGGDVANISKEEVTVEKVDTGSPGGMTINNMISKEVDPIKEKVIETSNPTYHMNTRYESEGAIILSLINLLIKDGEKDTERKINRSETIRYLRMSYATITKIK